MPKLTDLKIPNMFLNERIMEEMMAVAEIIHTQNYQQKILGLENVKYSSTLIRYDEHESYCRFIVITQKDLKITTTCKIYKERHINEKNILDMYKRITGIVSVC